MLAINSGFHGSGLGSRAMDLTRVDIHSFASLTTLALCLSRKSTAHESPLHT